MGKGIKRHMLAAAAVAAAACAGEEGNRLYEDYMARKQRRAERAAEARDEFLRLRGVTWEHVVTKRPPPGTINWRGGYGTESHIELTGKAREFAERYTQEEIAAGLWDMFDDKKRGPDLAAIIYGIRKMNAGGRFPDSECLAKAKRELADRGYAGVETTPFAPAAAPQPRTQETLFAALGDDPMRVLAERKNKRPLIDPSKFEQAERDRITYSGIL